MPSNFSVGANLMQLLLSMQEGEWDEVDFAVRAFQRMTAAHQVLPAAGGGGAVRILPGRRGGDGAARRPRQAHAELYMGLVETGVGLLPAGGGCKEMTLRRWSAPRRFTKAGAAIRWN
jgi:3-hydroxyacyl-CoA dehydrogenase